MLSIGLSLISVGVNSFGGGNAAKDFGSVENLLAVFVLVVILLFKHWTGGFLSSSSILVGIVAGYLAAIVMGFVLPTTGVTADGVEFTKAWVLNWNKVAEANWFAIPKLVPVKIVFDLRAIPARHDHVHRHRRGDGERHLRRHGGRHGPRGHR